MPTDPRLATVHVPVVQLKVPRRWAVGRVVFFPPGELEKVAAPQRPRNAAQLQFGEWAMEGIRAHAATTAAVRVPWSDNSRDQAEARRAAVETVRDALAVLRLYKRARYPVLPTDIQEFGLHGDIGSALQWTTTTRRRKVIASGAQWLGIIGDWTFSEADVDQYLKDPRFAYLNRALRRTRLNEFETRFMTAMRVRALSTAMLRPQLQVILYATALEALLAKEPSPGELRERGEFFRVAQRAAYLICGEPDHLYPSRPPCFYLHAKSEAAMRRAFDDRAGRGEDPRCSAFDHAFGLFEDRNLALHQSRDTFDRHTLTWHGLTADQVILYAAAWVASHRARRLSDLDAALSAFVRGGRALTQVV